MLAFNNIWISLEFSRLRCLFHLPKEHILIQQYAKDGDFLHIQWYAMCRLDGGHVLQDDHDLIKSAPSNGSGRSLLDVQESGYSTSSESAPLIQQQTKQASRFANQASQQNLDTARTATSEIKAALDSDG